MYFVYRTHYEGPLSRRVRQLPGGSVLAWFRRGWDRDPDASLLRVDDHLAQLAMHCSEAFGHQQWFLLDTVWAAAHPDLARSLLRYAGHWDPLD